MITCWFSWTLIITHTPTEWNLQLTNCCFLHWILLRYVVLGFPELVLDQTFNILRFGIFSGFSIHLREVLLMFRLINGLWIYWKPVYQSLNYLITSFSLKFLLKSLCCWVLRTLFLSCGLPAERLWNIFFFFVGFHLWWIEHENAECFMWKTSFTTLIVMVAEYIFCGPVLLQLFLSVYGYR